jgi:hypothetical protein
MDRSSSSLGAEKPCLGVEGGGPVSNLPRSEIGADSRQIISAVVLAMGRVKRLVKSDRNEVDGYAFSSIDRFLDLINPICVEAGLLVLMDEVGVADVSRAARGASEDWLRISYEIRLAHVSGQSLGPFRRHVDIVRTGPQAFGAAQSYVLKQFLRAQFQIPTGEQDDPDFGSRELVPGISRSNRNSRGENSASSPSEVKRQNGAIVADWSRRVLAASSGRELLAILDEIGLSGRNCPDVIVARISVLKRIIASAGNELALDRLKQHFSEDWVQLEDLEAARRAELRDMVPKRAAGPLPGESGSEAAPQLATGPNGQREGSRNEVPPVPEPASGQIDYGEIPYSEVAA